MRFFIVVFIIVILIGLFFISIENLADNGVSSLILAGISIFALYRIFLYLFEGSRPKTSGEPGGKDRREMANPIDFMIFGDISREAETDERKK